MLFDGKLDGVDLAVIDEERHKRNEKLSQIIDYVLDQDTDSVNINEICKKLNIKPTESEIRWMNSMIDEA